MATDNLSGDEPSKKLCFVIGPIGHSGTPDRTHADWLFKTIINPVFVADFPDFRVERADQIMAPGAINSQVIKRLLEAPLVIADMSQHNPNAFYELGIRHMMTELPTIHMILNDQKIPFDVAPYRAIKFSLLEADHLETAKSELKSVVKEITKPGFIVENPVTHAKGRLQLQQHAAPEIKVLLDEMEAIRSRLASLENVRFDYSSRTLDVASGRPGPTPASYSPLRSRYDISQGTDTPSLTVRQDTPLPLRQAEIDKQKK